MQINSIDTENKVIAISLSKRNLLTMLHSLEHPEMDEATLYRRTENDYTLVVSAEVDEQHYLNRVAGQMSPKTEEFIAKHATTQGSVEA